VVGSSRNSMVGLATSDIAQQSLRLLPPEREPASREENSSRSKDFFKKAF